MYENKHNWSDIKVFLKASICFNNLDFFNPETFLDMEKQFKQTDKPLLTYFDYLN